MRFSHCAYDPARTTGPPHGLTLATVLQAVWAILLSVLSGRDDVVYGTGIPDDTRPYEKSNACWD